MLLVILGIGLLLLAAGITIFAIGIIDYKPEHRLYNFSRFSRRHDGLYYTLNTIGASVTSLVLIGMLVLGIVCTSEKAINNQIEIYQEENESIETVISEIVLNYQEYEQETFEKLSPKETTIALSLYPELKSNDLVVKQLDIYADNNAKIKELKSQKAGLTTCKWWLYFGE